MISDYVYFEPRLHTRKNGISNRATFTEWVSLIGYIRMEIYKAGESGNFVVGEGKPVMCCHKRPHYVAKNRYGSYIPEQIDLNWDSLMSYIDAFWNDRQHANPDDLYNKVAAMVMRLPSGEQSEIMKFLNEAKGDIYRLQNAQKYVYGLVNV